MTCWGLVNFTQITALALLVGPDRSQTNIYVYIYIYRIYIYIYIYYSEPLPYAKSARPRAIYNIRFPSMDDAMGPTAHVVDVNFELNWGSPMVGGKLGVITQIVHIYSSELLILSVGCSLSLSGDESSSRSSSNLDTCLGCRPAGPWEPAFIVTLAKSSTALGHQPALISTGYLMTSDFKSRNVLGHRPEAFSASFDCLSRSNCLWKPPENLIQPVFLEGTVLDGLCYKGGCPAKSPL